MKFSITKKLYTQTDLKEWKESFLDYVDVKKGFFDFPSDDTKDFFGVLTDRKFSIRKKFIFLGSSTYINSGSIPIICKGRFEYFDNKVRITYRIRWKIGHLIFQLMALLIGMCFLIMSTMISFKQYQKPEFWILPAVGIIILSGVIIYNNLAFRDYCKTFTDLIHNKIISSAVARFNKV